MSNPWLDVDEEMEDIHPSQDGVYLGVFNQDPNEIVRNLKRPHAPIQFNQAQWNHASHVDTEKQKKQRILMRSVGMARSLPVFVC